MGRANPSLSLTNFASVGSGIATSVRAAMAGGNLGVWSVGALQTFGTGGTERNYWVLSAGSIEVLVNLNNSTTGHFASCWSGKRAEIDLYRSPVFWLAPDGGFTAAFGAALDPLNQSFWDHITVTLGVREPSYAFYIQLMFDGATNVKMYTVADDTDNMYAVYFGDRDGDDRYEAVIFADDFLVVDSIEPLAARPSPEAGVWIKLQDSSSPPLPNLSFSIWDESDAMITASFADNNEIQGYLNSLSSASITALGEIPTTPFVFKTPGRFYAKGNANYLRVAPYNDPTAYKDDAGTVAAYGWMRFHRYLLEPWEQGAANPT